MAEPLTVVRDGTLRVEVLLRVFYVYPLYWYATHLAELRPLLDPRAPDLRWPVAWLEWVGIDTFAPWVLAFGFASAVLAVAMPERRWVRAAVFLGLLEVLALKYSYGKIHHLMHGWLFTTFLFIWAPNLSFDSRRARRSQRQATLLVFGAAQVVVCMTYSLAGLGKIVGTLYQVVRGEITPLHPSALARHLADRLIQTHADSLLGPWLIDHPLLLWPLMLGTVYLQFFAVWAAFRPRLHRLWGFGLASFHAMSILTLTIDFNPNIMLLAILLVASPTAPTRFDVQSVAQDLPLFGALLRRREKRFAVSGETALQPPRT